LGAIVASLSANPRKGVPTVKTLTTLLLLSMVSSTAVAGDLIITPVPEPGVLGLFATAGVMLFLARKFRK